MDSIQSRKLMRLIEEAFHIKVTGREMLEHQTIQSLATYLAIKVDAINKEGKTEDVQLETISEKSMLYSDTKIIAMMEQFTQGKLEFGDVQRVLKGR